MKRLNIRDGVTMGHPYEIAELVQEYTNSNLSRLTDALIETKGVFAPSSDELKAQVSPTDVDDGVRVTIRPGFAICDSGLLHVQNETSITLNAARLKNDDEVYTRKDGEWAKQFDSSDGTVHLNLRYREKKDTPVEIVPYGSGEADLRVVPSYELKVEDSPVSLSDGVVLASATGQQLTDETVEDKRHTQVAKLRADRSLLYDLVDPQHVSDVETLFSRENFVADMTSLLDDHRLDGDDIVTEPKDAVDPFLIRFSSEPSVRKRLRDLDTVDADINLSPDPEHEVTVEWNLYGVVASFGATDDEFNIETKYDLTNIDYQGYDLPLYFRFDGTFYEVDSVVDASTIKTKELVSSDRSSDPNAAITNGADEFHVDAQPGIHWFRKNKRDKDFAVESEVRGPLANLRLDPGFWNIIIQSRSQNSQASKTIPAQINEQSAPKSPQRVRVSGEQVNPATEEDGEKQPANPFDEIDLGAEGDGPISEENLNEYVSSVRRELNRIQEQQVDLTVEITPYSRSRQESDRAIVIGYNVEVEMLTGEGWKTEREIEVRRPTSNLMREITWIDIVGDRYRGNIDTQGGLTNLSNNLGRFNNAVDERPLIEDEIVLVKNTDTNEDPKYWRYEPKMTTSQANDSSLETHPYSVEGDGHWIQVDVNGKDFEAEKVVQEITGVSGGSDYRVTVEPIGEDGQMGQPKSDLTTDLREAYNAELGFDFHGSINSIYSAFQDLSSQNSPERFNEYLNNRMEEIRGAIDRAALYGTPPKVTGPFQVPPKPNAVRFSGRNLQSVQSVTMTYTPAGNEDASQETKEIQETANLSIIQSETGDPQVLVKNMPNIENLSNEESPIVTFEFNGGARGSDYFTVQYEDRNARITGPGVAQFTGERTFNILETTTYQNTTSFWRYDSLDGSGNEPVPYGPVPKVWPGERSWDAKSNVFEQYWETSNGQLVEQPDWDAALTYSSGDIVYYRPTDDYYEATASISAGTVPDEYGNSWNLYRSPQRSVTNQTQVRSLIFNANRFNPSDILDVRVRKMTGDEEIVPQLAYAGSKRYGDQTSSAYYYALQIDNNQVEVLVQSHAQRYWASQDFKIEYVYYPTALQGGGLHDGKGIILEHKGEYESGDGWTSDVPSSASIGDYYEDPADGTYWVYDDITDDGAENPTWHGAERINFTTHAFTVRQSESERGLEPSTEVQFRAQTSDAADMTDLNAEMPRVAFDAANTSGRAEPPFTRTLQDGSSLELNALISPTANGKNFIFDEFRYQSSKTEKNRSSLPDNVKALSGTRKEGAAFGDNVISSDTDQGGNELIVDGGSVESIAIKSQYKQEQEIVGSVTAKLVGRTWEQYDESSNNRITSSTSVPSSPRKKILFTPDSGSQEYLIEAGDKIEAGIGDTITIQGIYTSFDRMWRGNGPYPVIRAASFAVGPTEPMEITGASVASINYDIESATDYGINEDYVVNREVDPALSGHSYSVTWASGSETLSSLSSSITTGTGQATINIQADWEDLWTNRVTELRELRPSDRDIGNDYYDGPVYREREVFDFRRPNINVLALRLKIEATFEGQTRTKFVSVQVAPDYNDYYV